MTAETEFEPDARAEAVAEIDRFVLALDGFTGPLDLLLTLAREQKVDITKISISALAEQYLSFIQRAGELKLDVAADYLVMAAWLAYLKSKLLLPQAGSDEEPSGAELAAALAFQLRRLEAVRDVSQRLMARPQFGIDFFARGAEENLAATTRMVYSASLFEMLRCYTDQRRRHGASVLAIRESAQLLSVEEALQRLVRLVGRHAEWAMLAQFLPEGLISGLSRNSALASTFAASLELARAGQVALRQDRPFGPIYVRRAEDRS